MTRKELLSSVVPRKVTVPLSLRPWWHYDPDRPETTNTAAIDGPTWADLTPEEIIRDIERLRSAVDIYALNPFPDPRDSVTTLLSERTQEARRNDQ